MTKNLITAEEMGRAMFKLIKPYYKEGRQRVREATTRERQRQQRRVSESGTNLVEACFKVMPEAVRHVSGDGRLPYGARRLYYVVREMIKPYTSKKLKYKYFRDTILQEYQKPQNHGPLKGLYYDPRGRLHEPHGGRTAEMGTREVGAYDFPPHVFNKLLYVEKKGQFPLLQDAKLMERYDLAIMTGEGFATEAARTLLDQAEKEERCQIFVLHDADPSGFEIARTVREETDRMPGYSVDVIDLGLTVEQGLGMRLNPEEFIRQQKLPPKLLDTLDEDSPAREFFIGEKLEPRKTEKGQKDQWKCHRFELDAMTAPQAIQLIENQLQAKGVYGKVIPPDDELPELAEDIYRRAHGEWVAGALSQLASLPEVKRALADEFIESFELENARRFIDEGFEKDRTLSWRNALEKRLGVTQEKHADALNEAVRHRVIEALEKE